MLIETLTEEEARALGTLIEKSLATPDYYPMTLNALRTACNQKSSREPVTDYDDETLSFALSGLKRKCLVTFIPYGSGGQHKYRHFLEDVRFNLRKPHLAALAVLLLRGAQTLNEIKTRASSLHPFASLEEAEQALKELAEREEPLAELLPKRTGWKEARWRDRVRLHAEEGGGESGGKGYSAGYLGTAAGTEASEGMEPMEAATGGQGRSAPQAGGDARVASPSGGRSKWDEFEELKQEVADLRARYAELKDVVDKLKAELY